MLKESLKVIKALEPLSVEVKTPFGKKAVWFLREGEFFILSEEIELKDISRRRKGFYAEVGRLNGELRYALKEFARFVSFVGYLQKATGCEERLSVVSYFIADKFNLPPNGGKLPSPLDARIVRALADCHPSSFQRSAKRFFKFGKGDKIVGVHLNKAFEVFDLFI